ncbi:MAG: SLBB domain-containing protein [Candidatus Marinimicrobia bacterium]|nr:SLBB domain-containing protein [Candidatus Neomarinimicrobiota bacterium]MBL7023120.1 SLBB domain-containing protein [Candidatus Neomarinimicrobiota bacterium]
MKFKYILLFIIPVFMLAQYPGFNMELEIPSVTQDVSLQDKFTQRTNDETIYLDKTINPETYIVGPGDELLFNMVASDGIVSKTLTISPMGEVLIPAVGTIFVDKLSLKNAINKIKSECLKKYQTASVYMTLTGIRHFKVLVVGTVENPGFVVVNPLSRVSDVLWQIGDDSLTVSAEDNFREPISKRNILLHRNSETLKVDLVKYNMFGLNELNPNLLEGDIVDVQLVSRNVGLFGGVGIPGKYEFVENESVYDLIQLAGGFTINADSNKIEITRFIDDIHKETINIDKVEESKQILIHSSDHIIVRMKKEYKRQDIIRIEGEVKYPGEYSVEARVTTIRELMNKCGGYSNKADKNKIIINNKQISSIRDHELDRIRLIPNENRSDTEKAYLKARSGITKGLISSSSIEYTQSIMNYVINSGDIITIPNIVEYIEVLGAVLYPGRYPFYQDKTIENYVSMAGGLTNNSTRDRYIIKFSSGQRVPFSNRVLIENGDIIFIAEKLEYNKWTRFKEITAVVGQIATIYLVIQSALGL